MRMIARIFSGPVMALLGINHFIMPKAYASIMPDYLPAGTHYPLVYASGVAEALAALGTMHPRTRKPSGLFLIATLVAIFPANVHMAFNPEDYPKIPEVALYGRLPLQVLFIYLVWLATQKDD